MAEGMIQVTIPNKKLKALQRQLRGIPGAMNKVMPRAINKTASKAKTDVVDGIMAAVGSDVNIRRGGITRRMTLSKAHRNKWSAEINVSGKRIPLRFFGSRAGLSGVTYQIHKDASRKQIVADGSFGGGFLATMKSGHKGVYKRSKSERSKTGKPKIIELFGPSIPVIYEDVRGLAARIVAQTNQKLEANIDTQVALLLAKRRGAA